LLATNFLQVKYCLSLLLVLSVLTVYAQPGMYNETDIDYQNLFFDAQIAKVKGDTDEQLDLLNKIIKRDKQSHAAYWELARTYQLLGDGELAQKNAQKAVGLAPNNEWYQLTLAEVYEKSEQWSKAITTYSTLKTLNPDNPTTYHKLAQFLLHENKVNEAAAELETLQNRHGVEEESSRRIFEIYKTAGKTKEAINSLKTLCEAYPDNTRYLNNLASYYKEVGKDKEADKTYKHIITLNPNDPTASLALAKNNKSTGGGSKLDYLHPIIDNMNLSLDDKVKELMPHVANMKKSGTTTTTLAALSEKLTTLYPEEAKVYSLEGDILFYQGNYKTAKTKYKKALELDDRKFALWNQYLQTLWELENYKELENHSEEAIDLYPNKVTAFIFNAIALSSLNKSGGNDLLMEAKYIAGKNEELLTKLTIVEQWLKLPTADASVLSDLNLKKLMDPLYMELAGDVFAAADQGNLAKQLWDQAIKMGASDKRLAQKNGL